MSKTDHARSQARAQFQSIAALIKDFRKAEKSGDETEREEVRMRIDQDPLSIRVRDGWRNIGEAGTAEEFEILLCTGGPAVRIIGELDDYNEPERAVIQYQDWGTPWTDWPTSRREGPQQIILDYCRCFYFGES